MNYINTDLEAGLYLVATPIGAARDITLRALDVLASADIIAAEDTRTARKLMKIHNIETKDRKFIAYHDHSRDGASAGLIKLIKAGRSVAYISEAGTPLVADPGYVLAREAGFQGLKVLAVPGASAVLSALMIAGLPTDRFLFVGFLPATKQARRTALAALASVQATLVFYESPKRVNQTLTDMCDVLGGSRAAAVCRELTKKFEEVRRGTLVSLAAGLAKETLRGEVVLVVDRAKVAAHSESEVEEALEKAMESLRIKDAATLVAGALSLPRREVYQTALAMKQRK